MYYVPNDISFSKRDEFNRKEIAVKIGDDLHKNIFPSPCLLNGEWGSGKSEFCYKLINFIKESNTNNQVKIIPIYINVFNAERINNPFLTLMGGIVGSYNNEKGDDSKISSLKEKAAKILKSEVNIKRLSMAVIKDTASWISDKAPNLTNEFSKQIEEAIDDANKPTDLFEGAFDQVVNLDKQFLDFTESLKEFATEKEPLLFVVDELDRCRPDFAIDFLECIKHFFDVKNVYFLLSCNATQLTAHIDHRYGTMERGEVYLNKFFKKVINLSSYETSSSLKYLSNVLDDIKLIEPDTNRTKADALKTYYKLLKEYPLRDQQYALSHFNKIGLQNIHGYDIEVEELFYNIKKISDNKIVPLFEQLDVIIILLSFEWVTGYNTKYHLFKNINLSTFAKDIILNNKILNSRELSRDLASSIINMLDSYPGIIKIVFDWFNKQA